MSYFDAVPQRHKTRHLYKTNLVIESDLIFSKCHYFVNCHYLNNTQLRYNAESAAAIEVATGFFLSDFVVITLLYKHYGPKQYLQFAAHHVVAVIAFCMVLHYRRNYCFIILKLFFLSRNAVVCQLSTPVRDIDPVFEFPMVYAADG